MAIRSNRRQVKTLELVEAIPYGGAEGGMLKELIFYKPRGKTMRRIRQSDDPGDQAMLIVHDLTEVPIAVLDLLDFEDALVASAIAGDLMEKRYAAASKRAKALGVSLPDIEPEVGNLADAATDATELETIQSPEDLEGQAPGSSGDSN